MKSHTPTKEERKWMDKVAALGCIVCKNEWGIFTPAEIHHLMGKTKKDTHFITIPLCYNHHRAGIDNDLFTSRHPFKKRFEQRYGSEQQLYHWVYAEVFKGEKND